MSRRLALIVAGTVTGAAALGIYLWARSGPQVLEAFGTVEARNIHVGSKVGGRVKDVLVREGDQVEAGALLVTFEDDELLAALEEARANLAKMERGSRAEEIEEARAAAAVARADLEEARNGYRHEQIQQARAEVEQTRADAAHATLTYERAERLAAEGVFSRQRRDDDEAAWKMAQAATSFRGRPCRSSSMRLALLCRLLIM